VLLAGYLDHPISARHQKMGEEERKEKKRKCHPELR